jgi:hypothetical protein
MKLSNILQYIPIVIVVTIIVTLSTILFLLMEGV